MIHLNEYYPKESNVMMISIALNWLETINDLQDKQIQSLITKLKDMNTVALTNS